MFKVIICLLNGRFPKYKFPLKVEGQSPYSIIICILCRVAMNCIIQDHGYDVQLAALYVPPFYTTTLGWYDWANEATFKHALEIWVNLCNYWGPYSVFIASMVMNLNTNCSVVINFPVDIFAVDVCYLDKCYQQYQFCLNVTNHEYFFEN